MKTGLKKHIGQVQAKLIKLEKFGDEILDDMTEKRRKDFEEINLLISQEILPKTLNVINDLKNLEAKNETETSEELNRLVDLQRKMDRLLRMEDQRAIEMIRFIEADALKNIHFANFHDLLKISSSVNANDISAFAIPSYQSENEITVRIIYFHLGFTVDKEIARKFLSFFRTRHIVTKSRAKFRLICSHFTLIF